VSGTDVHGKRVRENFKDAADAERYRQRLEDEALGLTPHYHLHETCLSPHQLRQAEAACRLDLGIDLEVAVKFYIAHHPQGRNCPNVKECIEEFLADCRSRRLRVRTIADYRSRTQRLVEAMPDRPLNTISSRELTALIRKHGGSHYSQNGLRRVLSALFSWAVKQDFLVTNPIEKVDVTKGELPEPMILPLDGVKRLLAVAMVFEDGKTLPLLVVALYCGLRPEECSRIKWSAFDFKNRTLRVSADVAKTRSRRIVELSDAAIAWLEPLRGKKLTWSRWSQDFREVRRKAGFVYSIKSEEQRNDQGLQSWCNDIVRHTAISNYYATNKDIGATAAWAGNSPDVIHSRYRALVSPVDANDYWNLTSEGVKAWADANPVKSSADL